MALLTGDYNVYSRKGGVDLYFHTFVLWASDWALGGGLNRHLIHVGLLRRPIRKFFSLES
jgi:hypothetical protein